MDSVFLFKVINLTITSTVCLLVALIIVIDAINVVKDKDVYAKIFNLLSMTVFISYVIQLSLNILQYTNTPSGPFGCEYLAPCSIVLYFVGRGVYYSIFIVRLHIIFKSSPILRYSAKLLFILFILMIVISIMFAISFLFIHLKDAYYSKEKERCMVSIPLYLVGLFILFDLTTSILTLYLFIKKLTMLINQTKSFHNETSSDLIDVALKSTVLVLVSIISTFILSALHGPLASIGLTFAVQIDWIINCLCIIFMKNVYDKYYKKLCHFPIKLVNYCCYKKYNKHQENMTNLEHEVRANSSDTSAKSANAVHAI